MTDNGWIKLWRRSIKTGLIKNHNVWIVWTYCLMKANHEKNFKCVVGYQEVVLQPGQFVFGRKVAAKETALSEQQIRTCIAFLKKYQNLTIKSTNRFSVITIVNWDAYQGNDIEINRQSNQHVTSSQPASNHIQEQKNKRTKEEKKKIKKKKSFSPPTQDELIKYFIENGYPEQLGIKVFKYYDSANWKDARGNQVKNWKQKVIAVWFKEENKINNSIATTRPNRSRDNAEACFNFIKNNLEGEGDGT